MRERDFSTAQIHAQTALDNDAKISDAWSTLGAIQIERGEVIKALESLAQALRLDPNNAIALTNLGLAHLRLKNVGAAERNFREALKIDPAYSDAYAAMGSMLYNLRRHKEAIGFLIKAVELAPNSTQINLSLGLIYYKLRDFSAAQRYLERALELDPTEPQTNYTFYCLKQRLRQRDEAMRFAERAVELAPSNFKYHLGLAIAYLRCKKGHKLARAVLHKYAREKGSMLSFNEAARAFMVSPPLGSLGDVLGIALPILIIYFALKSQGELLILIIGCLAVWASFLWFWYRSRFVGALVLVGGVLMILGVISTLFGF